MTAANDTAPVALVTGAAGGLGCALVSEFAARGWRVAAAHHHATPHAETESLWPVALDVTDRARVEEVVSQLLARWGRVDALINNAGVTEDALLAQLDEAAWDRVLDVNLKGAFLCSQAVLRAMMKRRDGHILNLGSFVARVGRAGQANYAAAKAGLIGLTESLAKEVGSRNVRVNVILPGVLATPMTAKLSGENLRALAEENALGRTNTVGEVARFAAFLAGTQNISGQVFQLDSRIGRWC
ncbi:MAG: SDR family NAD(P)-dependent oxidoreductase [Verrucomicrobia bacterium]|nr:SDR family NAD(P)-dependent oxidoreductase [Verrucomicrobiota bacterium]